MIPYLEWKVIAIGPLDLQVWGLLVAIGFLVGGMAAAWFAKHRGLDAKIVYDLLPWLVFSGLIGGRLGHVLFYDPHYYATHVLEIFEIWKGGLSIYGGFILSALVGVWYLKKRQVDVFTYADTLIFGLPLGMWIGRIGCFLIHDHPGTATRFILGVKYPDGIIRHDLGLYESLNGLVMALVFLWLARKPRPTGTYLTVFALWYGFVRFLFDFLRVADVRYFGLTPAQYASAGLFLLGLGVVVWIRKQPKRVGTAKLSERQNV